MFSSKDLFFTPPSGAFTVAKSLRFRSSASAYLARTPSSTGNRQKATISIWFKRGQLGSLQELFTATDGSGGLEFFAQFDAADTLRVYDYSSAAYRLQVVTTQVFRDPGAWYHLVIAIDTTSSTTTITGTSTDRVRLYVNGAQVTAFSGTTTVPAQNYNTTLNYSTTNLENWFGNAKGLTRLFDGYMAEAVLVDGAALDPTSFGKYDGDGIWQPISPSVSSYGTNGAYLKFTDVGATSGSNTGYGKDFSTNTNYFTTNNFNSTSTSTSYDSMYDTPTNYSNGVTGAGNYCVFSPIDTSGTAGSITDGNLKLTGGSAAWYQSRCGFGMTSGKWYWEVTILSTSTSSNGITIGISNSSTLTAGYVTGTQTNTWIYNNNSSGRKNLNGTGSAYGTAYVTNDVVGVAFDADAGTLTFYVNNSSQGTAASSGLPNPAFPVVSCYGTDNVAINFGQRPFAYTPPSGYSALNAQNLSTPTITNGASYMAAVTYQGATAPNTVTTTSSNSGNNPNGTTFQPDLVWIKSRSAATDHKLTDAVRGTTKALVSNSTATETTDTNGLTAFTASGFTVGSDTTYNNTTGPATYVAWEWNAGGSNATNTSGSITSTVRANTTAGFSVVTYTGNASSGATVGHGLGVTPGMVIVKTRTGGVEGWPVWHQSLSSQSYFLRLNETAATNTSAGRWTAFSASTITLGGNTETNGSGYTYVAYCFAPVAGYSAFGSYTGNGSADGPMIFTNFRPRFIIYKCTSAVGSWIMLDSSRSTINVSSDRLLANTSDSEASGTHLVDFLSNGFKLRNLDSNGNSSGATYIYAAFAENPFKISRAR